MATAVQRAPTARRAGRIFARLLVLLIILGVAAVVALIVKSAHIGAHHAAPRTVAATRRLPPYYTVQAGDTLAQISAKTGLSVTLLQAYNPNVNPLALNPGERLNLWQHPPQPRKPKGKPPGPMFWNVQAGQSFGSIAASTGISITTLEQLNPNLPPASLQTGDRVRLRH